MIKKESFSEIMEKYSNSSYEQIGRNIAKLAAQPVKKILGYDDGEFIKGFAAEASEYLDIDERCCYNMNFEEFLNIFERYLHARKTEEDDEVSKEDNPYLWVFLLMRYINKSVKENFAAKSFFAINYDIFCNYIVSKYSDIDIKKLKVPDYRYKSKDTIGDVLKYYLNCECVEYWMLGEDINEYMQKVRKAYDALYKGIYCLIARVLVKKTGAGFEEIHKKDTDEIQHIEKSYD